jgi:hypothetical protein
MVRIYYHLVPPLSTEKIRKIRTGEKDSITLSGFPKVRLKLLSGTPQKPPRHRGFNPD